MSESYSLGDLIVNTLIVASPRGTLNITASYISMSIYESIFTPGIVADVVVMDTSDLLGSLRFSGDEQLFFDAKTPNGQRCTFVLHVYKLSELQSVGAQKAKMYTLNCVSQEALFAKTNFVQKSYYDLCSNIVQDIHKTYLKSPKPITVEATRAAQNLVIAQRNPYDAIAMVRKRAVSATNKSSLYTYFESRVNNNQVFKFVTLESLFGQTSVKSFQQSDAVNVNLALRNDNNIISYNIPNQFSAIDRITSGGQRKIVSFNTTTQQYETTIVSTNDTDYKTGGSNKSDVSTFFKNLFSSINPPQSFIPEDISQRALTYIPETSADQQAYLAIMLQNTMKIKVYGDLALTAGIMINCTIPDKQNFTGAPKTDPLMTGNFLVSRIHHRIGLVQERPRYTCTIECLKGNFSEGIV